MSVINTNVMSLSTQLNLSRSQSALGTAIERLSSGMRINSAKDDAAGQAIANRFTSNIKGLAQARRNAMDGISIAQTTEGALNEINNNLQRVRELTVQAANGSNSGTDLDSIQSEIDQRLAEIDRISEQTQFNGKKVLAEDNELKLQVGAYDNETISVSLVKTDVKILGLDGFNVNGTRAAGAGTSTNPLLTATPLPAATSDIKAGTAATAIKVDATGIKGSTFGLETDAVISATSDSVLKDSAGKLYLEVKIDDATASAADKATLTTANLKNGSYYLEIPASVIAAADDSSAPDIKLDVSGITGATLGSLAVSDVAFPGTTTPTSTPLAKIDDALKTIDTLRGDLGAVQNRLESTINNLGTAVNNLSASRSRIEDADYAVEVSNMSRAQILQQAGTSVLAQANQVPQTVLSLLR